MNILITGGNGYIATGLYKRLSSKYNITSISRQTFDLSNHEQTKSWFADKFFDIVIHTAIIGGNRLKVENGETILSNLLMFDNLVDVKKHFNKLITFGSGAEFVNPKSPYGLSKKIINTLCQTLPNFYNLRLYALFDDNEDKRRFIKNNIYRYINQENIIIYKNKYMDFFYFEDFTKIVELYIHSNDLPKEIDCVYQKKYSLFDIGMIINSLDSHKSKMIIEDNQPETDYTGNYYDLNIAYIELEQGIKNTYRKIKNEKNMVRSEQI